MKKALLLIHKSVYLVNNNEVSNFISLSLNEVDFLQVTAVIKIHESLSIDFQQWTLYFAKLKKKGTISQAIYPEKYILKRQQENHEKKESQISLHKILNSLSW